jgi:NADH dehydrogenase
MAKIAVTGAFSYSGKYIAEELLNAGHEVITLTGNLQRTNPFEGRIKAFPFTFDDPDQLVKTLAGIDSLINTYWVRFDHGDITYLRAVSNTRVLFRAARQARVKRIVHLSITNPDPQSRLPYFWGKAILEEDLITSGMSYAILRPTVIFGKEDILINNITWFLRHFPLFTLPGDGDYRLQPIYVGDLAKLAAEQAVKGQNLIIDAIGPETFKFRKMLEMLMDSTGSWSLLVPGPPGLAHWLSSIVGRFVGDVVLTRQEVVGLMEGRLYVNAPPAGETRLTDWVHLHRDTLGKRYANELIRHY